MRSVKILAELSLAQEGIRARFDPALAEAEGVELSPRVDARGTCPNEAVDDRRARPNLRVDLRGGQKTGFFLDQRENRRAVAAYCSYQRVLDLYCYTGGFGLNALAARRVPARSSASIARPRPSTLAHRNAALNHLDAARYEVADAIPALAALKTEGERFGVVICDPPKFAKHPRGLEDALKGYLRLNRAALDVLEPNGVLVTCSCSGLVDRALFADMLGQVAELSGRSIQILEQRGQAADHPVSASCLEPSI